VVEVSPGSPAAAAGIKRGDYLLRADATKLEDDAALRNYTKENAGKEVTLRVRSNDDERDVSVRLRSAASTAGYLGVGTRQIYKLQYGPLEAVPAALYMTGALFVGTIVGVFQLFANIPALIGGLFASAVPAAAESASGPVGIVFILQSLSVIGLAYVFLFVANISVALAAFNALPLPALDGGRLALITFQKVFKRRINPETEAKIHAFGFMALIALMVVITIYDVRKHN
jgi:regulator of sigma E protease